MFKLFASYKAARSALASDTDIEMALDLGFGIADGAQEVELTLRVADLDDAQPFARRRFSAAEFDTFIAELELIRKKLRFLDDVLGADTNRPRPVVI